MRIAILGAGAVGGWLTGGLVRAGHAVGVLARGETLAALRRDGLVLVRGDRREAIPLIATDDPGALRDMLRGLDLLLLGLKGQDLPVALPLILALLGPDTRICAVQNGLPWWFLEGFGGPAAGLRLEAVDPGGALARSLAGVLSGGRIIGGVAHVASRVVAPGVVQVVHADRLLLGNPVGNPGPAAELAAAFQVGGVPAEAVADIRMEVWLKLWGNSNMNPLSALARADAAALLDDAGAHGLILAMMREMAALGERIGLSIPQDAAARIAATRRLGPFRTSMLQDLEAGRAMEVGPLLGSLVELAGRIGEAVPILAGVHGLLRLLAARSSPG